MSLTPDQFPSIFPDNADTLRIIPFGGCAEFGMNLTAYLYRERLFVVDAGVMYPDPTKLGVDAIIPKIHPWFEKAKGVFAYVITHGHEDHIGALPYLLERWPAPIYATPWTAELLRFKFKRRGLGDRFPVTVVEPGDVVSAQDFRIEYIPVNHSIPNACALMIRTPTVKIFHTGDFRIDKTPVLEAPIDLSRLDALGREGVDLMLADSTNAQREGLGPSESSVKGPLDKLFKSTKGALLITTFSSNFFRLKTVVDLCIENGRKLLILGNGIEASFAAASNIDLYHLPAGIKATEEHYRNLPRHELAVIATGSQGESRSALMRICTGEHKAFRIQEDDTVVFSSRIIPGNERVVQTMMAQLEKQGARVISTRNDPGIHVSGHAYRGEIAELVKRLKPRMFLPVHGTHSHLKANLSIPAEAGLANVQGMVIENGDVIDITAKGLKRVAQLDVDWEFIESDSYVAVTYELIRERLRIGEAGLAVVAGVFSRQTKEWVVPPKVQLQGVGLPFGIQPASWCQAAATLVEEQVSKFAHAGSAAREDINEHARVTLRRHLNMAIGRKPVVLTEIFVV